MLVSFSEIVNGIEKNLLLPEEPMMPTDAEPWQITGCSKSQVVNMRVIT